MDPLVEYEFVDRSIKEAGYAMATYLGLSVFLLASGIILFSIALVHPSSANSVADTTKVISGLVSVCSPVPLPLLFKQLGKRTGLVNMKRQWDAANDRKDIKKVKQLASEANALRNKTIEAGI